MRSRGGEGGCSWTRGGGTKNKRLERARRRSMHGGCEGTLLLRQELPQDEPTRRLRSPLQGLTPSRSGDEQSNQRASRYGHRRGNQATRSNVLVIRRETKKNSCTISDVSFTTTFGIKPRVQLEFWGNRKFFEEITNPPQKTNKHKTRRGRKSCPADCSISCKSCARVFLEISKKRKSLSDAVGESVT